MKHSCGLLTAALFLCVLPGTGWTQGAAGIPPMLETQRPLAMPASQPEPRAPQPEPAAPTVRAPQGEKVKKASHSTCRGAKTNLASHKKTPQAVKKKKATAKPKSKVAATH
jgi:hypothetical protein